MKVSSTGRSVLFLVVDSGVGDYTLLNRAIKNLRQDFVGVWVRHPSGDPSSWSVSLPLSFDFDRDFMPYFNRRIRPLGGVLAAAREEGTSPPESPGTCP